MCVGSPIHTIRSCSNSRGVVVCFSCNEVFFPYLRPTAQALPPRELHQRLQELVASLPELAGGMSTDGHSDRVGHGYGCSLPLFRRPVPFVFGLIVFV
jgi:hypothetical protein